MTAQILAAELGNLIQDSKRKNTELRTASEKALQDLKSLPVTSEAQLAAETFPEDQISSLLFSLPAVLTTPSLPKERLTEVLEALKESVSLSHDVQLKILQALPSLLQNYATEIRGELLSTALQICSALQNAKNFAVSNTAAATLQQLVIFVYDKVVSEDEKALEIPTVAEVDGDGGPISVRPSAHDAYKVFNDLNLLVTGEKPAYIRFSSIPSTSTLELIEAILSNHGRIMSTHAEQAHILRTLLMPMIIRSLSDRLSFPITLRIIRILNLLLRNHLTIMPSECEIALGLLNHMLDPEASPLWKRALCLEVYRGIYSDSRLVLDIFGQFDAQEGKRCILGDNLAAFVRLATEKPALIGLGQGSTVPTGRGDGKDAASEQAAAEAGALAGVIGGPVSESINTGHSTGISMQWSSLKTPCMEHLDKTEPPALPETYVYSLVLTCITNISESLARFVLPLTVHHENKSRKKSKTEDLSKAESEAASPTSGLSRTQSYRKKTIPVNPLTLKEHSAHSFIKTTSSLVTECWPAVLATCSTFLNAALDVDFYRALVRSIQKFTQVAGLLRLSTPRDAFLTTLGKAAIPPSLLLSGMASPKTPTPENQGVFSNAKGLLSVDSLVSQASSMSLDKNRRPSHENTVPTLGPRNLLCLRALLNLAIALGPTLQSAWSIIFETLQVADLIMSMANQTGVRGAGPSRTRADSDLSSEKVEAETSAVQAAARRLFESTVDFPNESFVELLQALCTLLNTGSAPESGQRTPTIAGRSQTHQRRMGSVSGMSLSTQSNARDSAFALNKIGDLAALNEERLSLYDPSESGWDVFVSELVRFSADDHKTSSTRLLAADIISRTVKDIAELSMGDEERNEIQNRILSALQMQISVLHRNDSTSDDSYSDTDIRIHQIALEALKDVIEQCGESLVAGWGSVFDCLLSVFASRDLVFQREGQPDEVLNGKAKEPFQSVAVISRPLARSAFGTVQLVCSDFLAAVPDNSLSILLELLLRFCCQKEDLNMSLTTITFFWNVSDFLHSRSDLSSLPIILGSVRQQDAVRQTIQAHSKEGTIPALWLQVLMDLSTVTTDNRAELRNSAVQTIQRIFENYVDRLSSEAWMLCLRTVLYGMVESNLAIQKSIRDEPRRTADDIAAWNETTKTMLSSISILVSLYMDKVEDASRLGEAWTALLEYFQQYFSCGSHALGSSVFATMTDVLSKIEDSRSIGSEPLLKTATVWRDYFNYRNTWSERKEDNQEAFLAYAKAFKSTYQLSQRLLDPDLPSMLANLETCIIDSDEVAYSSDVELMTPLQAQVMECLSGVRSETSGLPSYLMKMLGRFSVLPYTSLEADPQKRNPTFVALSKASMNLLQSVTTKHIAEEDIYASGAFLSVLESLVKPIQEKYIWQREGKPPTIWQKATTTALAVLEPGLLHIQQHDLKGETIKGIWNQVVKIASGIIGAQITPATPFASLEKDEAFDIDAFTKLRGMITISLGSTIVPDTLRRTYTRNLFETSIIHEPVPGEIPSLTTAPLEDLYKVRFGHTNNPEPRLRIDMAYVCLSELVSLLAAHDNSPARVKLAQAAAPYLILRAALPLRAYIADHPLRGRMPAPESQRRELVSVLTQIKRLESEPLAIPNAPGVKSTHKKHLHRLYPLLVQATRVARNDGEVFEQLTSLTEMVGDEFGLEDE